MYLHLVHRVRIPQAYLRLWPRQHLRQLLVKLSRKTGRDTRASFGHIPRETEDWAEGTDPPASPYLTFQVGEGSERASVLPVGLSIPSKPAASPSCIWVEMLNHSAGARGPWTTSIFLFFRLCSFRWTFVKIHAVQCSMYARTHTQSAPNMHHDSSL